MLLKKFYNRGEVQMIIKPKKPYLVSVEEQMEDQEIRIRNADMLVDATSM